MAARAKSKAKVETVKETAEVVISYKGFDQKLQCRGFQYEIGKTYEHGGNVEICSAGFHACEHPLDAFGYYPPAQSRFAVVEQVGPFSREENSDTKIASAKITIQAEIHISEMIQRAVKWVFDRAKPEGEGSSATGYSGAASATGYSGAASATGDRGAASATGDRGAAMASGKFGRAQAADGCALFLVYRDDEWKIKHAWAGIAGQNGIKLMVWYSLDETGKPVEVE